jgi:hypothetical protein
MFKTIAKAAAISGAISGAGTVLVVILVYIVLFWLKTIHYVPIICIGNIILYLPLGAIGGAFAGFVLGTISSYILHLIFKEKAKPRTIAVLGGAIGGIAIGLLPIWLGLGYI